jgi:hypothetical protein
MINVEGSKAFIESYPFEDASTFALFVMLSQSFVSIHLFECHQKIKYIIVSGVNSDVDCGGCGLQFAESEG